MRFFACKGNVRFHTFPTDANLHFFVYSKIINELDVVS